MTVADARDRQQVKAALIRLVEFAMVRAGAAVGAG
jgi:tetrahydrodipicolinate N-succinyltransferase